MKKSILILITNLGVGGAQRVFWNQLKFLSEDYHVTGCVFNWDGSREDDKNQGLISLDVPAGTNLVQKIRYFLQRIRKLRALKTEHNFSFVISHLEGADYVNILSRKNEKTVLWIHGSKVFDQNIEGVLGKIRKWLLLPVLYRRADNIVVVSKGIRDELIRDFGIPAQKITVIYNGFDLQKIQQLSRQPIFPHHVALFANNRILITHCRLARQKNLAALIVLSTALKGTKVVIIGDGELRESLLKQCEALSLSVYHVWQPMTWTEAYDIYFLGNQDNPYPFLKLSNLYIMTSNWEGFPFSLCEAMACGVPVIASDCRSGPREIIAPDIQQKQPVEEPYFFPCGVLMPMINAMELGGFAVWKKVIERLQDDEAVRQAMVQHAQARVVSLDLRGIVKQWKEVLHG